MNPDQEKPDEIMPKVPDNEQVTPVTPAEAQPAPSEPVEPSPTSFQPTIISPDQPTGTEQPVAPIAEVPDPVDTIAPTAPSVIQPQMQTPVAESFPAASTLPEPKKSKKKLYLILAGVGLLLLAALVYIFLFYLPNKPENVYRTGLTRSGKAINAMITTATDESKLQDLEKSEVAGDITVNSGEEQYKGNFTVKTDSTALVGNVQYDTKIDGADHILSADFLAKFGESSRYPDVYFRLAGIQEIVGGFLPGIETYDNKWIEVSSQYLETLDESTPTDDSTERENVTSAEIADLVAAISDVSNEYVFTNDSSKNVLVQKSFEGKEKTAEGVDAYRYKVGVDIGHTRLYCKALVEKLSTMPAVRKMLDVNQKDLEKQRDDALKNCADIKDDSAAQDTFDMWIDSKFKIIHKLRFDDGSDAKSYTDVGQIYDGGDTVNLFVSYVNTSEKFNFKLAVDVDLKKTITTGTISGKSEADTGLAPVFSLDGTVTAKPLSGDVPYQKPTDSIPIEDLLSAFGFGEDPTAGYYTDPDQDRSEFEQEL